jgi:hypothetical protein
MVLTSSSLYRGEWSILVYTHGYRERPTPWWYRRCCRIATARNPIHLGQKGLCDHWGPVQNTLSSNLHSHRTLIVRSPPPVTVSNVADTVPSMVRCHLHLHINRPSVPFGTELLRVVLYFGKSWVVSNTGHHQVRSRIQVLRPRRDQREKKNKDLLEFSPQIGRENTRHIDSSIMLALARKEYIVLSPLV